jgi:integrase
MCFTSSRFVQRANVGTGVGAEILAKLNKLSVRGIEAWLKGTGSRLGDGGGLYLVRGRDGGATWVFRYTSPTRNKLREAGLGAYGVVGLAQARELASSKREQVANKHDPLDVRDAEKASAVTFDTVAVKTLAVVRAKWTADDLVPRWQKASDAITKALKGKPVRDLTPDDIANVLTPYDDRPTTKRFVLSVMRRTLDTASAQGIRPDNPADARKIGQITSLAHKTKNNPAMKYADVPAFVKGLRERDSDTARCLEFIIRTGVRKSEATDARFSEFDFAKGVWTIPAERMKSRREHTVPLTERCIVIVLEQQLRNGDGYVFKGSLSGRRPDTPRDVKPLSHGAFMHLLPDGVTVHGFRSALRNYLGAKTDVSFEIAETVLAHRVGNATVQAYWREPGIDKHRVALTYWGDFIDGVSTSNANSAEVRQQNQRLTVVR